MNIQYPTIDKQELDMSSKIKFRKYYLAVLKAIELDSYLPQMSAEDKSRLAHNVAYHILIGN